MINFKKFILFLGWGMLICISRSEANIASPTLDTHTNTPIELKPAPLNNSYQLASVCFAGSGNCADDSGFSSSKEGYNASEECKKSGFSTTSCGQNISVLSATVKTAPAGKCPFMDGFYKECCVDSAVNETQCLGGSYALRSCASTRNKVCVCNTGKYKYIANASQVSSPSIYSGSGIQTCAYPHVLDGDTCNAQNYYKDGSRLNSSTTITLYSACTCPSEYSETCPSPQVGVGAECDGKYMSCKCPERFQSCQYGGTTNAERCSIGGGDFYTECKTLKDYCAGLGFESNICSETEAEQMGASNYYCPESTSFCKLTCRTELLMTKNYDEDDSGVIFSKSSPTTAYVLGNMNMPISNSKNSGADYNTVNGPASLTSFSKCKGLATPTVTANLSNSANSLNKTLNNLNVKTLGSSSSSRYKINKNATWTNVRFSSSNKPYIQIDSGGNVNIKDSTTFYSSSYAPDFTINSGGKLYLYGPTSGSAQKSSTITANSGSNLYAYKNLNLGTVKLGTSFSLGSGTFTYSSFNVNSGGSLTLNSGANINTREKIYVNSGGKLYASSGSKPYNIEVKSGGYASLSSVSLKDMFVVQKGGEGVLYSSTVPYAYAYGNLKLEYGNTVNDLKVYNGGAAHVTSGGNTIKTAYVGYGNMSSISSSSIANLYVYDNITATITTAKVYPYSKIKMNQGSTTYFTNVTLYGTPKPSDCSSKKETRLGNLCAYKDSNVSYKGDMRTYNSRMYHINCGEIRGDGGANGGLNWGKKTDNNRNGWANDAFHGSSTGCDNDRLYGKSWSYSTLKTYGG